MPGLVPGIHVLAVTYHLTYEISAIAALGLVKLAREAGLTTIGYLLDPRPRGGRRGGDATVAGRYCGAVSWLLRGALD